MKIVNKRKGTSETVLFVEPVAHQNFRIYTLRMTGKSILLGIIQHFLNPFWTKNV